MVSALVRIGPMNSDPKRSSLLCVFATLREKRL
jgi:hypothetical protein